jgi:hypothetical protein
VISRRDAEYRDEIIRFYFPEDKRKLGLEQLINSYTNAQILKHVGHDITPEVLQKEEERIDKNTLQPKKLEQIKAIFAGDSAAYRRVYILPTYADRVIYYEVFAREPRFHEESLKRAEQIRDEARKTGSPLAALAKKHGYSFSEFTVSREKGVEWKLPAEISDLPPEMPTTMDPSVQASLKQRERNQQSVEGEKWIREIISPLKPGEVAQQIINLQEHWQIVRFLKKSGQDRYEMESLAVNKANYNEWFEKEKAKVAIKRYD